MKTACSVVVSKERVISSFILFLFVFVVVFLLIKAEVSYQDILRIGKHPLGINLIEEISQSLSSFLTFYSLKDYFTLNK